jgi:hypothetical protein
MFNHLISVVLRKKMRLVKKKRNVDDFTNGNIRQIICRRGNLHAVELEM